MVSRLASLFVKGLEHASAHSTFFVPANKELIRMQTKLARSSTTLNELMTVANMKNSAFWNTFRPPTPLNAQDSIPWQFGQGYTGWYFLVGNCKDFAFVICPFRVELAAEQVVAAEGFTQSEAVVWTVLGGVGRRGGSWHAFPRTFFQCESDGYNIETQDPAFSFSMRFDKDARSFDVELSFAEHELKTTFAPRGPPLPMAPNGCMNCGSYGLSSMYFSHPDCAVTATWTRGGQGKTLDGRGWIDHQTFFIGQSHNIVTDLIGNAVNLILAKPLAWLWMFIQVGEAQYMLTTLVDPKGFKAGNRYDIKICNAYTKDSVVFNNDSGAFVTCWQHATRQRGRLPVGVHRVHSRTRRFCTPCGFRWIGNPKHPLGGQLGDACNSVRQIRV